MLTPRFFNRDAIKIAKDLLGKLILVKHKKVWLAARIIETEAYYLHEKGSHASLGFTEKRKALFMSPGSIYMYYARGGDSLNVSCRGKGNAVLIKSGLALGDQKSLQIMQQNNPIKNTTRMRPIEKLCSGQTLLCKSLGLKVPDWDGKQFDPEQFYIKDNHYQPEKIIQATRLGIPKGRDEHLFYRFIDYAHVKRCTQNPLTKHGWQLGEHYEIKSK